MSDAGDQKIASDLATSRLIDAEWRARVDFELEASRQDRSSLWQELRRNSFVTDETRALVNTVKLRQDMLPSETAKAVGELLIVRKGVRFAAMGLGTGALTALGASVWHWVSRFWSV
jgi:hypothetical protein